MASNVSQLQDELIKKWLKTHSPNSMPTINEISKFLKDNNIPIRSLGFLQDKLDKLWSQYDQDIIKPKLKTEYKTAIQTWFKNHEKDGVDPRDTRIKGFINASLGNDVDDQAFNAAYEEVLKTFDKSKKDDVSLDNEQKQFLSRIKSDIIYNLDDNQRKRLKSEIERLQR